ncbi:MAG: hypothetical protein EP346_12010 [Bacteroidetes bacterium]|nr:MAG: hypothetical protein EP346_12010 [Bacteroidota bacterium]
MVSIFFSIASVIIPISGLQGGAPAAFLAGIALLALAFAYLLLRNDRKHAPRETMFMKLTFSLFFLAPVACGIAVLRLLEGLGQ